MVEKFKGSRLELLPLAAEEEFGIFVGRGIRIYFKT
jgi:hypothetical protein